MIRPPPSSTLFPYTTLFRSKTASAAASRKKDCTAFAQSFVSNRCEVSSTVCSSPRISWLAAALSVLLGRQDRKSTRLNSSHGYISYAVFCLKKKKRQHNYYS